MFERFSSSARRVSMFVAAGMLLLMVLSVGICAVLLARLESASRDYELALVKTSKLESGIRRLNTNYFSQGGAVGSMLLEGDREAYMAQKLRSDSLARAHLAESFAASSDQRVRDLLIAIARYDADVTDSLMNLVVSLVTIRPDSARRIYLREYLPARQHNIELVRRATQLAGEEIDRETSTTAERIADAKTYSLWAIGIFVVVGFGVLGAFSRLAHGVAAAFQEAQEKRVAELKRFTLALQDVQERERKELSRDLHDDLGQNLAALRMRIAAGAGDRQEAAGENALASMKEQVDQIIAKTRSISRSIRPAALERFGLHPALNGLCEDLRLSLGLNIRYTASGAVEDRFDPAMETAAFRIAQEALTNVSRHAGANEAECRLVRQDGTVQVIITDNGGGFSAEEVGARRKPGLGLLSMTERAAQLGGSCTVSSAPGRGTTVMALFPTGEAQ